MNALEMRLSMGKVISSMLSSGEPVLIEKAHRPVAVLISLRDFKERFVEHDAAKTHKAIFELMDELAVPARDPTPAVQVLRDLRGDG